MANQEANLQDVIKKWWPKALIAVIALWFVFGPMRRSWVTIESGQRGVVYSWNKATAVIPDGLSFIVPYRDTVKTVSVRVNASNIDATAVSKDIQKVQVQANVQWHFISDKLLDTVNGVGFSVEMENNIMLPKLNEALKAVTAQYEVQNILAHRLEVKAKIEELFREKMKDYYIVIDDFNLVNMGFDADYEAAIEKKQIAQVKIQTAENDALTLKAEADGVRNKAQGISDAMNIQAQGEAKAKRLLHTTLTGPILALEWIQAWKQGGSQVPQIVGGNGTNFLLSLDQLKKMGTKSTEEVPAEK